MAGEIEEPFQFNFQAELLHSGSISFGRFESESLSWERRSSFSHNRYLEEVEKYSKPGSVTEKKAYFEAHFKRKALLKQTSSESQDGIEFQTSENNKPNDSQESENGEEIEIQKSVKENVETLCSENNVDESLYNLGYEVSEIVECEREELGNVSVIKTIDHHHMVNDTEHLKLEETNQIRTENVVLVRSEEDTKETLNDLSKVKPTSEKKQPKPKLQPQATTAHVRRIISNEASSNSSANSKTRENKSSVMKEKEKMLPRSATPIVHSGRKTSKSQESSTSFPKAKTLPLNKSIVKEYRPEKTMERKSLVLEKSAPGARQIANRTKPTISTPRKPHVNQASTGFTFMSDQRAEKRKEEKKAAELAQAQLRKSLNFKATPLPCFYKESARSSDQNKVISSSKPPNRPRTPSYTRPTSSSSSLHMSKNRASERLTKSYVSEKKKESMISSHKQKQPQLPRPKGVHIRYLPPTIAT